VRLKNSEPHGTMICGPDCMHVQLSSQLHRRLDSLPICSQLYNTALFRFILAFSVPLSLQGILAPTLTHLN